ncbi:UPF0056 membrane protein [Jeongeupia sp. HS-3]|uniref:MarC family protein n=1 Tax=Jeongeupia sp. HS-3 TaxID=1009682 RepID=UPI0018A51E98|nr:MarC family protein [Jeongeupia sp. HS-3]BCL75932.1 UPF0056 membrane protein [Jeongeupia sp. HS-3]
MLQTITAFLGNILLVVAALMPILNPPGHAPIFLSMTTAYNEQEKAILARRVGIYSFFLILVSMFTGSYVLNFFEVSLPIIRVAGGLLVAAAGWKLLSDEGKNSNRKLEEQAVALEHSAEELRSRAFYPLTFPITVGPGTITVAITLGAGLKGPGLLHRLDMPIASIIATALVAYSLYFCYRYAERIMRLLGSTGTIVFLRLSAFILFCLGVQIVWDGASALLADFVAHSAPALLHR